METKYQITIRGWTNGRRADDLWKKGFCSKEIFSSNLLVIVKWTRIQRNGKQRRLN